MLPPRPEEPSPAGSRSPAFSQQLQWGHCGQGGGWGESRDQPLPGPAGPQIPWGRGEPVPSSRPFHGTEGHPASA